jgi:hypothetical protein
VHLEIKASWNILRCSHHLIHWSHTLCCCSQLYIYCRILLLLLGSYYIFLQNLLFTCLQWFCVCYIYNSYITSNLHTMGIYVTLYILIILCTQFVQTFTNHPYIKFHIPSHKQNMSNVCIFLNSAAWKLL